MIAKRSALILLVILVSLHYQGRIAMAQPEELAFYVEVWQSTKELSVRKGENATFVFSIVPVRGGIGKPSWPEGAEVSVRAEGGPPGASVELSFEKCVPPCDGKVKVSTTPKTTEGEFLIVITAFRGSFKHEATMRLIVTPPPPTTPTSVPTPISIQTYLPWTPTSILLLLPVIATPLLIYKNRIRIRDAYSSSARRLGRGVESWLEKIAEIE